MAVYTRYGPSNMFAATLTDAILGANARLRPIPSDPLNGPCNRSGTAVSHYCP